MSSEEDQLPNGQLLLLDMPEAHEGAELLKTREERERDRYPLTTIERDQERLQTIIHLLAADAPMRYICRSCRVGWHTLESIRAKQGVKIAAVKKTIAQRMATFVQLGIEQLLDDLAAGRLDPDKLGVTIGIIADKMQVLTGEATSIIGTPGSSEGPRLTVETLRERLQRARVVDVEVTDLGTGSAAAENAQQAAPRPACALEAAAPDTQSDT